MPCQRRQIDRLGSSLPQRTKGVPEGPDYVMDVGRTKVGINVARVGNVEKAQCGRDSHHVILAAILSSNFCFSSSALFHTM